jgi:hypothetical protein
MTVFRNEGRWDRSNVEMSDVGTVRLYDKNNPTPGMRHIDYGLGVFHASAFDGIFPDTNYDLAELYRQLLQQGELSAFEVSERFYEVGSFEGINALTSLLAAKEKV